MGVLAWLSVCVCVNSASYLCEQQHSQVVPIVPVMPEGRADDWEASVVSSLRCSDRG